MKLLSIKVGVRSRLTKHGYLRYYSINGKKFLKSDHEIYWVLVNIISASPTLFDESNMRLFERSIKSGVSNEIIKS